MTLTPIVNQAGGNAEPPCYLAHGDTRLEAGSYDRRLLIVVVEATAFRPGDDLHTSHLLISFWTPEVDSSSGGHHRSCHSPQHGSGRTRTNEQVDLAFGSLHFSDIHVEEANGTAFEELTPRLVTPDVRQAGDAVPLQVAVQR